VDNVVIINSCFLATACTDTLAYVHDMFNSHDDNDDDRQFYMQLFLAKLWMSLDKPKYLPQEIKEYI